MLKFLPDSSERNYVIKSARKAAEAPQDKSRK